jgi:hypothetical protein
MQAPIQKPILSPTSDHARSLAKLLYETSINVLSNHLTPLYNKLTDKFENIAVRSKFKTLTWITLDLCLKQSDW